MAAAGTPSDRVTPDGATDGFGIDDGDEVFPALQRIADRLAAAIGRPVDIDDHRLRLLAHSSHAQPVDPVRLASILNRAAPEPVVERLRRNGVLSARGPLRVPAEPELAMDARLCVPIRDEREEHALGFLWLLDDGALGQAQVDAASSAASEAAGVLMRARMARIGLRARAQALVLDALSAEEDRSAAALRDLRAEGVLSRSETLRVAVSLPTDGGPSAADAIAAIRRATAQRQAACALRDRALVVLLADAAATAPEHAFERLQAEHPSLGVGIGPAVSEPGSLAQSFAKAMFAAELAAAPASATRVQRWEQLGPYRYLTGLYERVGPLSEIEPAVSRLAGESSGRELLLTLECFLDLGGQARESARMLNLHRSSLYHRLARIEELLGVDLHDGVQRLDAHLAVKAARVQGLLGSASDPHWGEAQGA